MQFTVRRLKRYLFNWNACTALLVMAMIVSITIFQLQSERDKKISSAVERTANLSLIFEQSVLSSINQLDQTLVFLRHSYAISDNGFNWDKAIKNIYIPNGLIFQISVINAKGMAIASTYVPFEAVNLGDREHFRVHVGSKQDELFISKPVTGRISRKVTIQLSRSFAEQDGAFGGVIVISVEPQLLTQSFDRLDLGPTGGVAVLGIDDVFRAGTGTFKSKIGGAYQDATILEEWNVQHYPGTNFGLIMQRQIFGGAERLMTLRKMEHLPLQMLVSVSNVAKTNIELIYVALAALSCLIVGFSTLSSVRSNVLAMRSLKQRNLMEIEKKVAESAAADRSMFLAVMSHEIRTPLNGVLGALDLLRECQLDDRGRRFADIATQSGETLLSLIDDILLFAKDENGKIQLLEQRFTAETLVVGVADMMQPMAKKSGNLLEVSICSEARQPIIGDPGRLRQVLINLMNNANKFTYSGVLTMRVAVGSCAGESLRLRFDISDTGIGIPEDKQKLIFNRFQTLDANYSRRADGTGLGLAICDKIVRAMGGEITVTSEVGVGSCFSFELEFSYARRLLDDPKLTAASGNPTVSHTPLRILLAEDNPTNAFVAIQFLSDAGHEVQHVVDGREAVKEARKKPFDLILMDISMPEMDGIEATAAIRSSDSFNARTKIIALTAHAIEGDEDKFLGAQLDGYLTKPIRKAMLLTAVNGNGISPAIVVRRQDNCTEPLIKMTIFAEFVRERSIDRLLKILDIFRTELRQKSLSLAQIISDRDKKELQMLAHSSLGSGAMVGAARLVSQSRAIELLCIRNETIDWMLADELLITLKETVDAFSEYSSKEAVASITKKHALAA